MFCSQNCLVVICLQNCFLSWWKLVGEWEGENVFILGSFW